MSERLHVRKNALFNSGSALTNSSTQSSHTPHSGLAVVNQLPSPTAPQAKLDSNSHQTQQEIENQEFQQNKFEATKLEIQAKCGTLTPEDTKGLTVLQAKMNGLLQTRLENASRCGHNLSNIAIKRPDTPPQQALQTKLAIGQPGDKYEQEADLMAMQVMKMSEPVSRQEEQEVQMKPHSKAITSLVQRQCVALVEEVVQTKTDGSQQTSSDIESQLSSSKGGGSALPDEVRAFMEPRFGHDFSTVRVHTDSAAVQMNRELGAQAFTHGSDVYYGAGKFPGKDALTAHELTHVVQQTGGIQAKLQSQEGANKISSVVRPNISSSTTPSLQASFISFAVKMGAKRVSLGILKNFIKTQIKEKIQKIAIKKFATQFAKEADDLVGILDDPWWVTAIGFIPVVGDAFDLARVPKQIATAIRKAEALEEKVKKILRIQGKKAGDLIPATLKKSDSYMSKLENRTYADIVQMAEGGSSEAKKMKKLIEQTQRLMEKL